MAHSRLRTVLLAALLGAVTLTGVGCGQKGPLYHPEAPAAATGG